MIYSKKNVMAIHEDSSKWGFGDGVSRWVCTGISIFRQRERDFVKNINKRSLEWGCKRVRSHHTRRRHMVQATLSPAPPERELR